MRKTTHLYKTAFNHPCLTLRPFQDYILTHTLLSHDCSLWPPCTDWLKQHTHTQQGENRIAYWHCWFGHMTCKNRPRYNL